MQVDRQIKGNSALDDVDHALGRPYRPINSYRNHYATCCPKQKAEFRKSDWWEEGDTRDDMTFFHVSDDGRKALENELKDESKYGRLYSITAKHYDGETQIMAQSRSKAKYRAYINADLDWTFIEYCKEIRVRLAA